MKLLLDTHVLLWAAQGSDKLPAAARSTIEDRDNELVYSVINLWEVVIKHGLARPDFRVDPHRLRQQLMLAGYSELPVNAEHVLAVAALPPIHKDPFDRMLIAQATVEGALLLTADKVVLRYSGPVWGV